MARKKKNEILVDHGSWLEVDVSTECNTGSVMKIDFSDWNFLLGLGIGRVYAAWHRARNTYPYASVRVGSHTRRIHRLLLPGSECVDHINRDGLDNRRSNLRVVSNRENLQNKGVYSSNTSGTPGVTKDKRTGRWMARANINMEREYLGMFPSKESASKAVEEAIAMSLDGAK